MEAESFFLWGTGGRIPAPRSNFFSLPPLPAVFFRSIITILLQLFI